APAMRKFARKFPKHEPQPDFCRFFGVHCRGASPLLADRRYLLLAGANSRSLVFCPIRELFRSPCGMARPVLWSGGRPNGRLLPMRLKRDADIVPTGAFV